MLLRCVTWWKRGWVTWVTKCHSWALWGYHILSAQKEDAVFSQGGEKISHMEIKSGPKKLKWAFMSLLKESGFFLNSIFVFLPWWNSHVSIGIKVLSVLHTFLCIETENKDGNALACFESSILTSKHFYVYELGCDLFNSESVATEN